MNEKRSLAQWLSYIEHAHTQSIDMSLTRIRKVFAILEAMITEQRASSAEPYNAKCIVTVAGTNGKGTSCRFIEQACVKAGYSVGVYASPHILRFNERIRVNGEELSDECICEAFELIEQAREKATEHALTMGEPAISLSYFEYATLCGLAQFMLSRLDVWVLEVGLGGRLDATNIIDANIGVITSIGLDHQSYLGDTTELIAAEKAGIIKSEQDVVVGYADPHQSLLNIAHQQRAKMQLCGLDFGLKNNSNEVKENAHQHTQEQENTIGWLKTSDKPLEFDLTAAQLPKQNIMTAIACLHKMANYLQSEEKLLLPLKELQLLIEGVQMPGRMQVLQDSPKIILDVAHNEAACEYLCNRLQQITFERCHIVVGMLKDKNIEASLACLRPLDPTWYCVSIHADISAQRGESAERLHKATVAFGQASRCFDSVGLGLQAAINSAQPNDIIVVVGSFIVASQCMQYMNSKNKGEIE